MLSQVSITKEMSGSLHSRQKSVSSFVVSIPEDTTGNEQILKSLNELYSPVLKLLKLFGAYYGQTNLKHLECTPTSRQGRNICSKMYCGLMISLLCLNFVMAVSGIFASGAVFVFLMFTLGNLLIVICGITSLIVLPLAIGKKSRFQQYLLSLLENSRGINLNSVKKKSRKGFIVLCLLYVETVTFSIVSDQKLNFGLACCKPWNEWYGFRVIAQFSLFTGSAIWLLSMYFFYLTCRILLKCFDGLYKRMSSLPPLSANFTSLKMEQVMRGGRTCRQDARSTPSRSCGVIHPNVVHQFLQLRHFPRGYEVNGPCYHSFLVFCCGRNLSNCPVLWI